MAHSMLRRQSREVHDKLVALIALYDAIDWMAPGAEAGQAKLAALSADLDWARYFVADLSTHVLTAAATARAATSESCLADTADGPG